LITTMVSPGWTPVQVHPAKLTKPTFWFSVDLVRGVVDYLRVLAAVSSHRELTDQRCVRSAIERYRHHLARVAALHKKHPGRRPEGTVALASKLARTDNGVECQICHGRRWTWRWCGSPT
jgi:hypothetical protein